MKELYLPEATNDTAFFVLSDMPELADIINIIFIIIGIVIVAGIALKFFRKEKIVQAKVIDKQCFDNRIIRKNQAPFTKKEYVITFDCGGKKLNFEVSEFSYNNYRINQKGTLKYKGNRLIDFS
ncbi:MAG: DUF2500 family protein [Clostridia bacterium]|nr:DUF2500 family protein [Clostridia bacterium]